MNNINIKGEFLMNVFKIINGEKHLIEKYSDKNLVVNTGKYALCRLLTGDNSNFFVNEIAFGEGTSIPHETDTTLLNEYKRNIIDYTYTDMNIVNFNWELLATEGNGLMITEYGLFANGNFLFARKVRDVIEKKIDIVLEGTWKITFQICP